MTKQLTAQVDQMGKEILDLDEQVRGFALELASRREYERTVSLVMKTAAGGAIALGAIIAFLGFGELAEIEDKVADFEKNADLVEAQLDTEIDDFKNELSTAIDDEIALFFDRNTAKASVYKENVDHMERLIDVLAQAETRWLEIKPALEGLGSYDADADIKGDFLDIIRRDDLAEDDPNFPSRAEKVSIVTRVAQHLRRAEEEPDFTSQFAASDIFNAAQIARSLSRSDLERELINAAYELDNTSQSTRALFLQWQALYGPERDRDQRFNELLALLAELSMDAPHIVVAEAWNAAEGRRRYSDLIQALDARIAASDADPSVLLTSHVFAIKGNAHQRRGLPGELETAAVSYVRAINRLALEGLHTQWWQATLRDILEGVERLLQGGVDISLILKAAERSGILPLQQNISMLVLQHEFAVAQTADINPLHVLNSLD